LFACVSIWRRHVGVLVGVWFLLQPPWTRTAAGALDFDTTRPLDEWERQSYTQSLEDCQASQWQIVRLFLERGFTHPLVVARLASGRCVEQ
jgi:hypothetical protein